MGVPAHLDCNTVLLGVLGIETTGLLNTSRW